MPGETETIQWESYGDPANTFLVEYSIDNGVKLDNDQCSSRC